MGEQDAQGVAVERQREREGREFGIRKKFAPDIVEWNAGEKGEAEIVVPGTKRGVRVGRQQRGGKLVLPAWIDLQQRDQIRVFGGDQGQQGRRVPIGREDVGEEDSQRGAGGVVRGRRRGRQGGPENGPKVKGAEPKKQQGPAKVAKGEREERQASEKNGVLEAKRGKLGEERGLADEVASVVSRQPGMARMSRVRKAARALAIRGRGFGMGSAGCGIRS